MTLPPIFSRRKRERNEQARDIFVYDSMSPKLRQQAMYSFDRLFFAANIIGAGNVATAWTVIVNWLREEIGAPHLYEYANTRPQEFANWWLSSTDIDRHLDAIEMILTYCYGRIEHNPTRQAMFNREVEILNARMLEDSFGYQIEGQQIISYNNKFTHEKIIIPALLLTNNHQFVTVDEEFRKAHDEYRSGEYEDSIHDCCNAFESTLKIIFTEKGWPFSEKDTAKSLLEVAFREGLIPPYMQSELAGLRQILESGIPTIRNRSGGHGQGAVKRNIPQHIAEFQLNQTASAILLLVKSAGF